jgi:hypothetical protein
LITNHSIDALAQEKNEHSSKIDAVLSIYPEKIKFGDIVFLRIVHKNNTDEFIKLDVRYNRVPGNPERSIYNIAFSNMDGMKLWERKYVNSCCEGWGAAAMP